MAGTSKMTEAEIDKLTVAKLKALLDEKEIAYEKKELKATLAAKLKESFAMKEEGGKEDDDDEEEEKKTTKKRKAASSEEEEPSLPVSEKEEDREEEEDAKKKKKKVSIAKKKSKKEEEEEEEKKEFSDDDDSDDDEEKEDGKDIISEKLESLIADPLNPENCTMTVYIKGNEGRLIGKKGNSEIHQGEVRASIKIDRESGTCAVKGPTSEMEECKKIIQEVCETGQSRIDIRRRAYNKAPC